MRIVVDLQACQSGSRLGGIGRYSLNLLEALIRQARGHEVRVVLSDLLPHAIPSLYERLAQQMPRHHIQVFQAPGPVQESFPENRARARAAEWVREYFIQSLNPDIVHVSSVIEGLGDDVLSSVGRVVPEDITSATLYDLIPLVESDRYLTDPVIAEHYHRKLEELRRAGLLLAISEHSRQEGIEHLHLDPSRVVNIAAGVDERFTPRVIAADRAAALRRAYGIHGRFLLFTSSFDQRKNHARLIQAYARLPASIRKGHQLVIVGNGWDAIYEGLRATARKAGLASEEVIFAGHVPDDDLLDLYNLCELFVFPSLSEGYGLPVLEAMACGIPTIASNTTSLPEVMGWDDALFDPYDPDSIARSMHTVLTDHGFRDQLRSHGLTQARRFTWDRSARIALEAFEAHYERTHHLEGHVSGGLGQRALVALGELLREQPDLEPEIPAFAAAMAANEACLAEPDPARRRIGWITTWNTRCGIAMYARHLAGGHLNDYTILAPYEDEMALEDEPNVVRCWHRDGSDLRELAEQIRALQLDTLLIQFNYGLFDFQALKAFLREMIATGRRIFVTLHSTTDTTLRRLSDLAEPLSLCNALLVHARADQAALEGMHLKRNVENFPHGVAVETPAHVDIRIPPGRFVVACYGFFLPHKGYLELLEACAQLVNQGEDIHLLMVNARYPAQVSTDLIKTARQRIKALGLGDRVNMITDFLEDRVSLGYLSRADLVVYPYQHTGESSSAAVRMGLAARRPVAVTPLSIFDDVRPGVHDLPGTQVADLAHGILSLRDRLRAAHADMEQVAAQADQWLETHHYPTLAARLWQRLQTD
ncbi:glycosyltransferase [Ectothiorhodospira variabilis]|uniref:glycosyltransferase n=1 Tax=Ectothiorhodospira variabilis TaxID=505694 RepID=UPI001EFBA5CC|nr:glycosyltransferase [Ectothiorhodospira variabilis]MCG5496579.1 glycosyltransferase [Ectothiorhodospira variabilis]